MIIIPDASAGDVTVLCHGQSLPSEVSIAAFSIALARLHSMCFLTNLGSKQGTKEGGGAEVELEASVCYGDIRMRHPGAGKLV